MKVATPHWLPDGDKASAGISVSAAATKKACSVAVKVSSGSTSSGTLAALGAVCASAATGGAKDAATAVPAPIRKLRRRIGLLSSAMAPSRCPDFFRVDAQPGSMPLALITALASGEVRNLIKAAAPSAFFAAALMPPENVV